MDKRVLAVKLLGFPVNADKEIPVGCSKNDQHRDAVVVLSHDELRHNHGQQGNVGHNDVALEVEQLVLDGAVVTHKLLLAIMTVNDKSWFHKRIV